MKRHRSIPIYHGRLTVFIVVGLILSHASYSSLYILAIQRRTVSSLLQLRDRNKNRTINSSHTTTQPENMKTHHSLRNSERKKKTNQNDSHMKDESNSVQELFLEQRLDHFASHPCDTHSTLFSHESSSSSSSCALPLTFQQRYFTSNRFVYSDSIKIVTKGKNTFFRDDTTNSFTQMERRIQDHNNSSSSSSFEKRPSFAFLCIGGEGPYLDTSVLIDSVHCTGDMIELAKKLHEEQQVNVYLFALEHRYYGLSYPTFPSNSDNMTLSPVTNEHLLYLSSRQALADIANFITLQNSILQDRKDLDPLTQDEPLTWITFGGSYPGMLSAWARLEFPHLVAGSVSSSAPLQVQLDFGDYKDRVAWDLSNTHIGGSPECVQIIQQGHEQIQRLLETHENWEEMARLFSICDGTNAFGDPKNIMAFLGDGVIDIPAQENDPHCKEDFCNIEKICKYLISTTSTPSMNASNTEATTQDPIPAYQALAKLSQFQQSSSSSSQTNTTQCKNISWSEMLSFLSSPEEAQVEGTRSWYWQTCTEVGFFQTCNVDSKCPFGRGFHPIDLDYEICQVAFGIHRDVVQMNVRETLSYYGGWDMKGTNILSVNGDVDPWSTMSMRSSEDSSSSVRPTIWIEGASHHFWTHPVQSSDGEAIQKARESIYEWVTQLLLLP